MTEDSPRIELTSAQRGIWYAQKIEPDNPTFQIGLYVEILGPLDVDVMRRAVGTTVAEADSLNVVFGEDEQGVFQKHGSPRSHLHFHDLRGGSVDESMAKAQALMEADLATVHDTETGELLRSELFHLGEDHWIFYQRAHHLLVDGYSAVLILRRESQLYGELADPAAQPSDSPFGSLEALAAEEADYRVSQRFRTDADFWSQTIAESETATGLAGRPPASAKQLVTANADIPPELARQLASAQSAPTLILAAAATYLHRMTGRKTVSVGLPVTARRSALAKSVPSMMSKILPLQLTTAPETTFPELLESTGSALRSTLIHQRFQYQELDTDTSYIGPSVNIFPAVDDISFGQAQASLHLLSTGPVDDLSIIVHGLGADQNTSGRDSRTAIVRLEANAELYSQESLADHLGRFLSVLAQLDPGHKLSLWRDCLCSTTAKQTRSSPADRVESRTSPTTPWSTNSSAMRIRPPSPPLWSPMTVISASANSIAVRHNWPAIFASRAPARAHASPHASDGPRRCRSLCSGSSRRELHSFLSIPIIRRPESKPWSPTRPRPLYSIPPACPALTERPRFSQTDLSSTWIRTCSPLHCRPGPRRRHRGPLRHPTTSPM